MQNRIDAVLSPADRDHILNLISQLKTLLPFLTNLTAEDRSSLVKMGDKSRPFVEQSLILAEQDDSYLPRSFDVAEMRRDKELYEAIQPILIQLTMLSDSLSDTNLLIGSDLMMAGLEIYRNARDNGKGAALDSLVPLLGRRFSRKSDGNKGGNNDGEPQS